MTLPDHVPVTIGPEKIWDFKTHLEAVGYVDTFYQIRKPRQMFGYIKIVEFEGREVEHHVRCFTSGKITTEVELKRIDEMWLHLTTRSISAHERVIKMLEELGIEYKVDQTLRERYALEGPREFVRDHMEFFRWLVYGVFFWSPLGYLWMFGQNIRGRIMNGNGVHYHRTNGVWYRKEDADSDLFNQ